MESLPRHRCRLDMDRVGDRLFRGPVPGMSADIPAPQPDQNRRQVRCDVYESADCLRAHGIVVGGHPHVVVPRQSHSGMETGHWFHRWQGQHRCPVRREQIHQPGPSTAHQPANGQNEPRCQLGVEIIRGGNRATRYDGCLQVFIGSFDDAFRLWILGLGPNDFRGQDPGGIVVPAPDTALVVPVQSLGNSPEATKQLPHPLQEVAGGAGGNHRGHDEP